MCKQQGIKPGEKIAVKQNSYLFTNRQEDKRHMEPIVNGNGLLAGIINAGARMWHDPNRGRLGSWMFWVDPDGTIHISDRFEGTEREVARGKNDTDDYNEARDFWYRGTTHKLEDEISVKEQEQWLKDAGY